ncbi:uracil-DNA glycosylase family protein [Methylocella silvestris]|uniref:uracil-DNA glycosylase family protein n=1 Tax=Methylocella silvestris TaxID=199596 RepID=UPI00059E05C2|nr:uracil-DNA glycosylase family protein [Methylocella silvestris]
MTDKSSASSLSAIAQRIRACRLCLDSPRGAVLPHEPRPVLRVSGSARLLIASQAPGIRVHQSGLPFNDASGDRLRLWMNVSRDAFYDESRIAIAPMGFCFPGHGPARSDLPPRPECRALWHDELFAAMGQVDCVLAIGRYAQDYHFARLGRPLPKGARLDEIVRRWREFAGSAPKIIALPHPSWRNSGWLKRNPWFDAEVLPALREEVARLIA